MYLPAGTSPLALPQSWHCLDISCRLEITVFFEYQGLWYPQANLLLIASSSASQLERHKACTVWIDFKVFLIIACKSENAKGLLYILQDLICVCFRSQDSSCPDKNPHQKNPWVFFFSSSEHESQFWVSLEPQTKSKLPLDADPALSPLQNTQEFLRQILEFSMVCDSLWGEVCGQRKHKTWLLRAKWVKVVVCFVGNTLEANEAFL